MPPKQPFLYNLNKTTIAFSFAAIILSISLVMMVFQDSTREWKGWQRKFMEYMREKTEAQLHDEEKQIDQKKLDEINKQIETARVQMESHGGEIKSIKDEQAKLDVEYVKAKSLFQQLKQEQESDRYFYEESENKGRKYEIKKFARRLDAREPRLEEAKRNFENLEAKKEQSAAQLMKFSEEQIKLHKEADKMLQNKVLLEKKVNKLKPDWIKVILNAPMLDFIRPTLQVQQIVVEKLYDDFYFSKAQKVDRCITCHLGIDQKGLEDAPQPFKSHPRLDLFLSSDSPHPMEKFGCTVCHGGSGQSVSFTTAAHTPVSKDQAEKWEKEYGWREMHHWSEKMLPLNHTEAACAKCHTGTVEVPQAPKLNEGRHLVETYGCTACHKVQGFERWKVGPGLEHVQSKLEGDWIVRWLQNPKEFRPSTRMPKIFHLSNTSDPESAEKNNIVISGIAAYLMKNSDRITLETPKEGDPKEGEKLVKEIGCLGCHTAGGQAANDHGPELSSLGSKVKPDWLYTWLKDPKKYHAATRMPNLRLSDKEAADITAYLLTQKNEKFESVQIPQVKAEVTDNLVLAYMQQGSMRMDDAKAEIGKMNAEEKLVFIGKKAIAHQGCFGCHEIKGFEDTKQIGTELSVEGSKDVNKLYFGFVDIENTRQAWFTQKLKEPRIFDKGKVLPYLEKLRMPQFDFTAAQAQSIVTFLLSQQKVDIPLDMQKNLTSEEKEIEAGRLLVHKLNCQGCHTVDGKDGRVRSIIQDLGNAPPIITGEGKKVQSVWLYHFLAAPKTIRPWLHYRMPTFGFDDKQLNTLVQYFNQLDRVPAAFSGDTIAPPDEDIHAAGKKLFQTFQCIKCHKSNPDPKLTASFLAPDLTAAKNRLRTSWVLDWLKDPQSLMAGTMMPTFFADGQSPVQDVLGGDASKQIESIRDYIWEFTPEEAAAVMNKAPAPQAAQAKAS